MGGWVGGWVEEEGGMKVGGWEEEEEKVLDCMGGGVGRVPG